MSTQTWSKWLRKKSIYVFQCECHHCTAAHAMAEYDRFRYAVLSTEFGNVLDQILVPMVRRMRTLAVVPSIDGNDFPRWIRLCMQRLRYAPPILFRAEQT